MSIDEAEQEKQNEKDLKLLENKFLSEKAFPPLKRRGIGSVKDELIPFKHSMHLIFVRAKFLFLGLLTEIEKENAFAAYAILKSFWETVAIVGYFVLNAEELIAKKDYKELFILSRKLVMGGRKFPSEEMVEKKGLLREEITHPNLLTMMEKIDKEWDKLFKKQGLGKSSFREEYDNFIAEAGHPTYLGMQISGRWLADGSLLPDIKRSWTSEEGKIIINYICLSGTIFFYYWVKFRKLAPVKRKLQDSPNRGVEAKSKK